MDNYTENKYGYLRGLSHEKQLEKLQELENELIICEEIINDKNSNSYKVTEAYEDRRYYTEQIEYLYKIIDNTKKTK